MDRNNFQTCAIRFITIVSILISNCHGSVNSLLLAGSTKTQPLFTTSSTKQMLPVRYGAPAPTIANCSNFPAGLTFEKKFVIDNVATPWKSECPERSHVKAVWSSNANGLPEDMKCCKGFSDHVLSYVLPDLHYRANGSHSVQEEWPVECPSNSVVTGLRLANAGRKYLSAVKCSLLVNNVILYNTCVKLDVQQPLGAVRDPSATWAVECPPDMAVVGLHGNTGFQSLKYVKCCKMIGHSFPSVLPWTCRFREGNFCGWNKRDGDVKWKCYDTSCQFLTLTSPGSSMGTAMLSSPAYTHFNQPACLHLEYVLIMFGSINVYTKSHVPGTNALSVTKVASITYADMDRERDMVIKASSNFQIVIEGRKDSRYAKWSNVHLKKIEFLSMQNCQVNRCAVGGNDCEPSEICIPWNGFNQCRCKSIYRRIGNLCLPKLQSTDSPGLTTSYKTTTESQGNHRGGGGSGKTDTGGEKKPGGGGKNPSVNKFSTQNQENQSQPWLYSVIGGLCGMFMVLFLVFTILAYRKRQLVMNRRHGFNNNIDLPVWRLMSVGSEESHASDANNNIYVREPTTTDTDMAATSSDINLSVPQVKNRASSNLSEDNVSLVSSASSLHRYYELENDLERKVSQLTLVSPMYGSQEDSLNDSSDEKSIMFMEPSSDEKELCAQLNPEIPFRSLELTEIKLGQGAFGHVHFGHWNKDTDERIPVAVKTLIDATSNDQRIKFLQEAVIMRQFAHQNVIFMCGVVTLRYPLMIVLEYMSRGNLWKYLNKQRKVREKNGIVGLKMDLQRLFLRWAREISSGMSYLAGMQFVHRDLAARNILLDNDLTCKIADFGLARDLIGCNHYTSQGGRIPVKWTSPEALNYRRYSSASDVWSFGIILFEIWSLGRKPYEKWTKDRVIEQVCQGYRLPPPNNCPRYIYHLMIDCWHPDENKRPRFPQIRYCLGQNDIRILGRSDRPNERIRSVTCTDIMTDNLAGEDLYGDLQYAYCMTN